jgi:hypothetical protein
VSSAAHPLSCHLQHPLLRVICSINCHIIQLLLIHTFVPPLYALFTLQQPFFGSWVPPRIFRLAYLLERREVRERVTVLDTTNTAAERLMAAEAVAAARAATGERGERGEEGDSVPGIFFLQTGECRLIWSHGGGGEQKMTAVSAMADSLGSTIASASCNDVGSMVGRAIGNAIGTALGSHVLDEKGGANADSTQQQLTVSGITACSTIHAHIPHTQCTPHTVHLRH